MGVLAVTEPSAAAVVISRFTVRENDWVAVLGGVAESVAVMLKL
jgi:hypothetical protein